MHSFHHRFSDLFHQLGLPSDIQSIQSFLAQHSPLASTIRLENAAFWSDAQAELLRDEILQDADWAEVIDQLNLALRNPQPK